MNKETAPFSVGMFEDGTLAIIIGDGDLVMEVTPSILREIAAGMYAAAAAAENYRAAKNN
ncbi:MAG: hypothetical protein ACO39R_06845 [Pontimonas sp.]